MSALIITLIVVLVLFLSIVTVQQGTVSVLTMFGKYRRILYPGLNFRIPLLEVIFKKISVQNRSIELDFQAITQDQANVYFKAMLLYSVVDNKEETLKNVAFKFVNERDFMTALIRTIEGGIRGFVATKKQAEILSLRKEIVEYVK
ncbi:MAG: SPFH domain-containing protein, partial [Bacteroidia bacterium]